VQIHAEAKLFIQCCISILNFNSMVWLFGKAALLFQGKIKLHGAVSKCATSDFTSQSTTAGQAWAQDFREQQKTLFSPQKIYVLLIYCF
jgi:hypothetical protein